MKGKYLFLAEGFEDTEALATLDVLRRGGIDIPTVSIEDDSLVTSSHELTVVADMVFSEFLEEEMEGTSAEDVLIFPGGMPGTKNLAANAELMAIAQKHFAEGGLVACICAAPGLVASQLPEVAGRRFTCFTGFEEQMLEKGAVYTEAPVEVDGNLITGKGAGRAIEFGLAVLKYLKGDEAVEKVKQGMMLL